MIIVNFTFVIGKLPLKIKYKQTKEQISFKGRFALFAFNNAKTNEV